MEMDLLEPTTRTAAKTNAAAVVLLGMMGAGKSSLGEKLAARLNMPFIDTDAEIEKDAQMRIADIFAQQGEAAFRQREHRIIARLLNGKSQGEPPVLALGGGAFMDAQTRKLINDKAISIWLDVPLDELTQRMCSERDKRPLLAGKTDKNIHRTLLNLQKQRNPLYAKADKRVSLHHLSLDEAVEEIIAILPNKAYAITA